MSVGVEVCWFLSPLPYGSPLGPVGVNDREGESHGVDGIKDGGRGKDARQVEEREHKLE